MPRRRLDRPNLLFILADQHRYDAWSAWRPWLQTPNLARLAGAGVSFDRHYVQAQVCVASRASLLTGRYAELHRVWGNRQVLPPNEITWADVLASQGYETLAVGRTHRIHKGFEHVKVPMGDSYPMIDYNDVYEVPWGPRGFCTTSDVPLEDFYEVRVAQTAARFIEDLSRNQPFALYTGFIIPHMPYVVPEPFASLYRPEQVTEFGVLDEEEPPPPAAFQDVYERFFSPRAAPPERQRLWAAYYFGMVSLLDHCIGLLLDALDRAGLADSTLVVYTADHGEQLGHRRLWSKGYGWDPSIRVPMLMRFPGMLPAGRRVSSLTRHIDVFPTLLEALAVERAPAGRSGKSFWELARVPGAAQGSTPLAADREWVYSSGAGGKSRVYCDSRWKLWYEVRPDRPPVVELYDLANDALERHNLAGLRSADEIQRTLMVRLFEFSMDALQEPATVLFPDATQVGGFNAQFVR